MNKLFYTLTLAVLLIACQNNAGKGVEEITSIQASELIDAKPEMQVLDVRTAHEFQEGHLANATNIDWNAGDFENKLSGLDKSKPVVVYCLSTARSQRAADALKGAGFNEVYLVSDGLLGWRNNNLPLSMPAMAAATGEEMSIADFNLLLDDKKLVLIDFYADWCGPCKKLSPILEEIAQSKPDSVKLVKIDVDANQQLANYFGITSIPLVYGFKDKNKVWELTGLTSKEDIEQGLAAYLN